MPSHLEKIVANTRVEVERRKAGADFAQLERAAASHVPRGFAAALRGAADRPAVIAELKKASPSRGLIRAEFDVVALARALEQAGAAALSVLTDEAFFQGSLENLSLASAAVKIPCLRKDFMVDPFQMLEARAHGADAVLLIAAALTDAELRTLADAAHAHGLDILCEVHSREELDRVAQLGCHAYGVNSRNLKTFDVSLSTATELVELLPGSAVKVAESGIHTAQDIRQLRSAGYDAFLVGESLMRRPDPGRALAELLAPVAVRA